MIYSLVLMDATSGTSRVAPLLLSFDSIIERVDIKCMPLLDHPICRKRDQYRMKNKKVTDGCIVVN